MSTKKIVVACLLLPVLLALVVALFYWLLKMGLWLTITAGTYIICNTVWKMYKLNVMKRRKNRYYETHDNFRNLANVVKVR